MSYVENDIYFVILILVAWILSSNNIMSAALGSSEDLCICLRSESSKKCLHQNTTKNVFVLQGSTAVPVSLFNFKKSNEYDVEAFDEADHKITRPCYREESKAKTVCKLSYETKLILLSTGSARTVSILGQGSNDIIVCEDGLSPPLQNLRLKTVCDVLLFKDVINELRESTLSLEFEDVKGDIVFQSTIANSFDHYKGTEDHSIDDLQLNQTFYINLFFKEVANVLFKYKSLPVNSHSITVIKAINFTVEPDAFVGQNNGTDAGILIADSEVVELWDAFGTYVIIRDCKSVELFNASIPSSIHLLSLTRIEAAHLHESAIMGHNNLSIIIETVETVYYNQAISFPLSASIDQAIRCMSEDMLRSNSISLLAFKGIHFQLNALHDDDQFILSHEFSINNVTFQRPEFTNSGLVIISSRVNEGLNETLSVPNWVHLCKQVNGGAKHDPQCPRGYYFSSNTTAVVNSEGNYCKNLFFASNMWLNILYIFITLAITGSFVFTLIVVGIAIQRKKQMCSWKPEKIELNSTRSDVIANVERFMRYSEILHICGGEQQVVTTLPRPPKNKCPSQKSKRHHSLSQLPETRPEESFITLLEVINRKTEVPDRESSYQEIPLND